MKISPDEAFLILRKWQVEITPVVLVGSLMPGVPLRGLVAVVTREGICNGGDKPASTWGFSLTGKETNFLASAFENFEYLQPTELPSEIKVSLPVKERDRSVLALTKVMKLPRLPRAEGDALASVAETLFLVEDNASHVGDAPSHT
ncbi:MAG: hypothetical protein WAL52_13160 [Candidatus Sulfotelmatobacter sp.]